MTRRLLSQRRIAEAMLMLATFFWGWTFPVIKDAVADVPVFAFLAIRFFLGAILLLPLVGGKLRRLAPGGFAVGFGLGAILFCGFALQTEGLARTSASNSAFLTGLTIVWIALLAGPLVGKKPSGRTAMCVAMSLAGLLLLTWRGAGEFNFGDALAIGCSVFFALHILGLDKWGGRHDAGALAFLQIATVSILSAIVSIAAESPPPLSAFDGEIIFAFALTALGATVFAFWAQTHFQHRTTPARAGLIFILEPVFAAIFSALLYGERMGPHSLIGAILMLSAMAAAVLEKSSAAEAPPGGIPVDGKK